MIATLRGEVSQIEENALIVEVVEAQAAIQSLPKDAPKDVDERLRVALQHFQ